MIKHPQINRRDQGLQHLNDALPGRRYESSFHNGFTSGKTMNSSLNCMHDLDEYTLKNR